MKLSINNKVLLTKWVFGLYTQNLRLKKGFITNWESLNSPLYSKNIVTIGVAKITISLLNLSFLQSSFNRLICRQQASWMATVGTIKSVWQREIERKQPLLRNGVLSFSL